ncbi:hypothetical protein QZH46_29535 [Pseudomonas corrugata]
MPERDDAGLFDLFQRAGQFGGESWGADQSDSNGCAQEMGNDTHRCFLDIVFFISAGSALSTSNACLLLLCWRPDIRLDECRA